MNATLLTTKLHVPSPRPDLVPRPRLIQRLDEGLRLGRKLTLVSAPAGFGKTTLLSEWVATADRPVGWVSLDEGDNDPTRLWAYLVAALQTALPGVGEAALEGLRSPQPSAIEAVLTSLINEIAATATPCILVVDDFHVVTNPQVNDAVALLVSRMPPQLHLVVSARADPPWPLARMRARGDLTEVRADDLRFTEAEATVFLNDAMGLGLSLEQVAALGARAEGWIAGLQMAALSMRGRDDAAAFIRAFSGSHRFVLDYLVEEVLDRQPARVQEFLLQTSVLEQMTGPLCDAVTGRDDGQAVLTALDRDNLFLVPLDDERRWYRYHRLFADLLRSRLQHDAPDRLAELHRAASRWFEREGLAEDAVAHALAGQDLEHAARLIEQSAMAMIAECKNVTLSRWLETLPTETVRARASLCVYRAWTRYWTDLREQGEQCLQDARRALASESGQTGQSEDERWLIVARLAAVRSLYAITYEDVPHAQQAAQEAVELLPEGDYMRIMAVFTLGAAHWGHGDVAAAERTFAEASAAAQRSGYRSLAVAAKCYAGTHQAKQGRLREAWQTFQAARRLATGLSGRHLPAAGPPSAKLGALAREWNDLEAADRDTSRGVELCVQVGQPDSLVEAYVSLARLRLAQADLPAATDALRKAGQIAETTKVDPWVSCWLDDCRLRLWLSSGDIAAAVRWAEASGLRVDGELSFLHDLNHVNLARVLVAQSTQEPSGPFSDQALGLLARLREAAAGAGWVGETIRILILQALALRANGAQAAALATLERALHLAEPEGYVRTFLDEGEPMVELLRQAATRGISVGYVSNLLAASVGEPEDRRGVWGPVHPALVEPLTERELEVLRLLPSSLSSTEIAAHLVISVHTARTHIKSIYGKLDVHSRLEAVQRARELGLL